MLDHECANGTFQEIRRLADAVQHQDTHIRESAQAECQRYTDRPYKAAVEEKRDQGLTAGAEGEVGGIGVGIEGDGTGGDTDEDSGKASYRIIRIVQLGEEGGNNGQNVL